ncbi:hypothetical protein D3C81_1133020 [compost metagenome]
MAHAIVDCVTHITRILKDGTGGAGVDLTGQTVEGIARTGNTEVDDLVLQRRTGRAVVRQRGGGAELVTSGGDIGERIAIAADHQVHRVGVIHQCCVEERVLRQVRSAEGAIHATARRDQRIRGVAGERCQRVDLQSAAQRRGATDGQRCRGWRTDGQRQHPVARIGQVTGHAQRSCFGARGDNAMVDHRADAAITAQPCAVGHGNLPTQRRPRRTAADLQHTLIDRDRAAERIITGQQQGAGTAFEHRAKSAQRSIELTIEVLQEEQRCVVEDIALQAGGVTDQRTAADRGATAVGVGAAQYQRAGIKLLDPASAHQRRGDFCAPSGIDPHRCKAAVRAVDRSQRTSSPRNHAVTAGEELQTSEVLVALHRNRTCLTAEHRELTI